MTASPIPRDLLAQAFPGNPRLIAAMEEQSINVAATSTASEQTVATTAAIQDATVLTLSPNDSFANERILTAGKGVNLLDDGSTLTISIGVGGVTVDSDFGVTMVATGETTLLLPESGTLATRSGTETLANKTLQAPKLAGLGNYVNDAAAEGGGVPVGGVYRNGSALMIRVA